MPYRPLDRDVARGHVAPREDGKYVYRKLLARHFVRREAEIRALDPSERSDDEHLILFLADKLAHLDHALDLRVRHDTPPEPVRDETALARAYEELSIRHMGIMSALRGFGYRGSDYGVELSAWLRENLLR